MAPSAFAKQEIGIKQSCVLPYDFNANLGFDVKHEMLSLKLAVAENSVGVPFNVAALNSYNGEAGKTWAFAVKSSDEITYPFAFHSFKDQLLDLSVHGPNGFYRRFRGHKKSFDLSVNSAYEHDAANLKCTGPLLLGFNNVAKSSVEVMITDLMGKKSQKRIKLKPQQKKLLKIETDKYSNWYNLIIEIIGDKEFKMHFSGHIEIGKISSTDPFMGGIL